MGIFGNSSPFDTDVEKATSENNTSEEWGLIMEICDKGGSNTTNSKDCLRSIVRRLGHPDPHVVVQAITLLDACVNNCGKTFHLEIASREFETEYRKLLTKAQPPVAQKLKAMLKRWAEGEFKTDPQLNLIPSLVSKLKSEGIDFSDGNDVGPKKKEATRSSSAPAAAQKEEEDLARAIELSLQESKHTSPRNSGGSASKSLYPTMQQVQAPTSAPPEAKKVRALYDFEAVEDNELTFTTGEIIHVIDSSDPNWWKGYNQRGEGLFPANFVTFDLTEPQPKPEPSQRKVQFSETVSTNPAGPGNSHEDEMVEVDEGKIDRLLSLLHEANPEDASSDTAEMIQLENEVYRMGPMIDQALEKADRQHAQLTQLSADLVDALNLYHTLMREPPPSAGLMKPPFPQASHYPPPQMFNGTTTYQNVPSMNPYFTHIQQPTPVSMNAVSTAGMPMPMMGMPQQSMPMMMGPMGPASLGALQQMGPQPQQPPPGPPSLPQQSPHHPAHHPQATPNQTYTHQQPSFVPPSGGMPQSLPPQGTPQGYVM